MTILKSLGSDGININKSGSPDWPTLKQRRLATHSYTSKYACTCRTRTRYPQDCEPKTELVGRFSVFLDRKTIFSIVFFGCPRQTEPKNRLPGRFFGLFCFTAHSSKKTTETEWQFRWKNRKTDRAKKFSVVFGSQPTLVATWYQHLHTDSFKLLSF